MLKILMLTNDDLILCEILEVKDNNIIVKNPFSIYSTEAGESIMPYMFHKLMEPMETLTLRDFDIMWSKNMELFPQVHVQYVSATTGLEVEQKEKIIL